MSYTTTATSCTTLTIYQSPEDFAQSVRLYKSEEQNTIQLMSAVFKRLLEAEADVKNSTNFEVRTGNIPPRYKSEISCLKNIKDPRSQFELRGHRRIMIYQPLARVINTCD